MSSPMTGVLRSSSQLVSAQPTTPPAGPLRIDLSPENVLTSVRPPSLHVQRAEMAERTWS